MPCMTVVRPVLSEKPATMKDNISSTVDLTSSPSDKVQPVASDTTATAGIVRPMLVRRAHRRQPFRQQHDGGDDDADHRFRRTQIIEAGFQRRRQRLGQ